MHPFTHSQSPSHILNSPPSTNPPCAPHPQRERSVADGTAGAVDTALDMSSNAVHNLQDAACSLYSSFMDTANKVWKYPGGKLGLTRLDRCCLTRFDHV